MSIATSVMSDFVKISGEVLLYGSKAPYEKSGVSLKGALEFDPDNDRVRCHECGEWFKDIATHAFLKHELRAHEYKQKHGFANTTALISEGKRINLINRARGRKQWWRDPKEVSARVTAAHTAQSRLKRNKKSVEHMNSEHTCPVQLLSRMRELSDKLGHTPSIAELRRGGISPEIVAHRHGSVTEAIKLAGLSPAVYGNKKYSRALLRSLLRNFIDAHKRVPSYSDARRGLIPNASTFERVFGSWRAALESIGKEPYKHAADERQQRNGRATHYDKQALISMLRSFKKDSGRAPHFRDCGRGVKAAGGTFRRAFGSWSNAIKAAGITA